MLPLYLVVILIFAGLILITLLGIIFYLLVFKKVEVVIIGVNGIPNEIMKGKKKKNRIFFKSGINFPIVKNYVAKGKRRIYFARKLDEQTYEPFNLKEQEIADIDYPMLSTIADSYKEGAERFKYGLEKYAPLAVIAIVTIMCIIGTIMSIKYNTDIEPVEAEMFQEMTKQLAICTAFIPKANEINVELAQRLQLNKVEDTTPN